MLQPFSERYANPKYEKHKSASQLEVKPRTFKFQLPTINRVVHIVSSDVTGHCDTTRVQAFKLVPD